MFYSKDNLPDDPETLKGLCAELMSELERRDELLRLSRHRQFGASSESAVHPGMKLLFAELEKKQQPEENDDRKEVEVKSHKKKVGRKPLPEDLPREDIELDLSPEEKHCSCCGATDSLKKVSDQISEKLHIVPAKAVVKRFIRPVYSCKKCETMKAEPLPVHPIPKCSVTLETVAHICVSKYIDSLPLYRQEQIFLRQGAEVDRSNMARWMIQISEQLQPLRALLHNDLLAGHLLMMDETTVQVLKEKGRTPTSKSYMLVQARGDPKEKRSIVLFHYNPSRSKQVVADLLKDFEGIFMTDGLGVYDALCLSKTGVIHAGCWQHGRRKFTDALKALKASLKKDSLAAYAVRMIDRLFKIEKQTKDISAAKRLEVRLEKSKPIIEELDAWLTKYVAAVPAKTQTGAALRYMSNQWPKLIRFLEDGNIPLHNNFTENMIRPFTLGRKNWLFSDRPEGAEASATLYSLLVTAKVNGLDPYQYLCKVLAELPKSRREEDYRALLPYSDLQ